MLNIVFYIIYIYSYFSLVFLSFLYTRISKILDKIKGAPCDIPFLDTHKKFYYTNSIHSSMHRERIENVKKKKNWIPPYAGFLLWP